MYNIVVCVKRERTVRDRKRKRERERQRRGRATERDDEYLYETVNFLCVCVCVSVCIWMRARPQDCAYVCESERVSEWERKVCKHLLHFDAVPSAFCCQIPQVRTKPICIFYTLKLSYEKWKENTWPQLLHSPQIGYTKYTDMCYVCVGYPLL